MLKVNQNIRYLRKKFGYTQEQFAELIGIKRSLVGAYEEGRADPRLSNLVKMADTFGVSLDTLINKEVQKLSEDELTSDIKYLPSETQLKVLSITVDNEDQENIELVPQKASAGYLNGYSDPEYIEDLPKFQLPILPGNATYRAFEINGDSMLPLQPGTVVIGRYIENIFDVKNGKTYVVVTNKEGVVYKRVFNYIDEHQKLYLVSDNKSYAPFDAPIEEIVEIWEAVAYISVNFPEPGGAHDLTLEKLASIVLDLQKEVIRLKED